MAASKRISIYKTLLKARLFRTGLDGASFQPMEFNSRWQMRIISNLLTMETQPQRDLSRSLWWKKTCTWWRCPLKVARLSSTAQRSINCRERYKGPNALQMKARPVLISCHSRYKNLRSLSLQSRVVLICLTWVKVRLVTSIYHQLHKNLTRVQNSIREVVKEVSATLVRTRTLQKSP